ncbi:Hypothetical protein, putative [Bodo saltans]|uniref:C3H1-type domain-containing protein n=1 Tax=Bodo saltans TaxID=75058 RepID=A0A0S4IJD2_BODSA|nr:Hypothetical protein, putative [Bodo saltans]|eukprot:CUE80866.1 Hypothetical protein, putative [Bodo saltans]
MYSPYTASHEMYGGANPYGGYPHHHGATQYHHHTAPRSGLQMPHSSSSSYPTPQQFSSASNTPMQRQRTPNNATQHNNTPAGAAGGRTIAAGGAGWYQQQQGHHQHHNPLQQYPTPNSNSSFQKGAAPWMNQQQQLQSTSISPVAINGASSMKNHHSAYYYNNSQQQQQQQQHSGSGTVSAATAATATSLADKICPMSGKGLERELMCATKEELVQVLLDLSSCNIAASTFIQSKAQLFSLQATHMMGFTEEMAVTMTPTVTISIGRTTTSAPPTAPQGAPATIAPAMATATNESQELTTPSKELFSLDDSSASWQSRFSSTAKELNTMESPVSASAPPAPAATSSAVTVVGKTPVRRELQERHITPETRAFAAEVHPCLRLYGACRHSVNCIFKTLPRNLCLHWIRGSCAGGADCGCVHRFPVNCPEQVRTVYELSHGGDRIEVAKRAESTAERVRVAAAAAVATSAASGLALVGTPERQRFSVSNHHQKLELSPIPYTMDEEDMESAVTPRNENQRISTLMAKAAASSGQDHLTAAREAHQLMTAASATAEEIDTPTTAAVERCLKDGFDAVMDDDEPSTI